MNTINFSASFFIKTYKVNSDGLVTIFTKIFINNIKTELNAAKLFLFDNYDYMVMQN